MAQNDTIFDLPDLGSALADDDVFVAVDVSDPAGNADGTTKKVSSVNVLKKIKLVNDTAPQLGGALDTNSKAINESEGANIADSGTPDIFNNTDGNTIHLEGATTITDFPDAPSVGIWRKIIFDGIRTLTHGSGITLPGSASITTAAGDYAFVYADTVSAFTVIYFKADGTAVVAAAAFDPASPGIIGGTTPALVNATAINLGDEDFDVYDEGTWTPTLVPSGVDFDSITYNAGRSGSYTLTGNRCNIEMKMKTNAITKGSATGSIRIEGFPFAHDVGSGGVTSAAFSVGNAINWLADVPIECTIIGDTTVGTLQKRTTSVSPSTSLQIADLDTGSSKNEIIINGTYLV